jgi:hypothetical protein
MWAALSWDPQIRGFLIPVLGVLILCGSVYMLLGTNLGSRLGFLVALAGLFAWLTMLCLVWTIYGIGDKGKEPTFEAVSIVQGPLGQTARPPLDSFPAKWHKLPEGDALRNEAQATLDATVTGSGAAPTAAASSGSSSSGTGGSGGGASAGSAAGNSPVTAEAAALGFTKTTDYVVKDAYETGGGHHYLFGIHIKGKGITYKHDPHYAAIEVQPAIKVEPQPGQKPPTPEPDPTKPQVTVLLVRDLGQVRLPSFLLFLASLAVLIVILSVLHHRDRVAMAARGALPART